ncbi:oadB_C [Klebsiella pneumoniae]|nr:oadB_C [Klebsiella pneumoniae]
MVKVNVSDDVSQMPAAAPAPAPAPAPASAPAAAAPAGAGTPVTAPLAGTIWKVLASEGQTVAEGEVLLILEAMKMETEIRAAQAGTVRGIAVKAGDAVAVGDTLMTLEKRRGAEMESLNALIQGMGLMHLGAGQAAMLLVSLLLLWLAIAKKFEPLLLLPIGFGGLLSNIPEAGLALTALESLLAHHDPAQLAVIAAKLHCAPDVHAIKAALALALPSVQGQMESLAVDMGYSAGVLAIFYKVAIGSGIAPLVIFMGVGAMTDFGPLLANPRTLLLGAAAQFGIFATVLGALTLNYFGIISFTLPQAAAIGIIGGADGPTAIYLSGKLAPELLGAIAVAAYSYMALVPLIQPPIMKALTTDKERKIRMVQLRTVSKREKILFPAVLLLLVALLLPDAAPLLGMFCFGNLMRESGVVERLSDTVQNALINIVTIFLGLSVGAKLVADKFLQPQTLGILVLGVIAFCVGTAAGVLMAKLMNVFSRHKINPLIGSAGVIGSAIAAGVMLKYVLAM